MFRSSSLCYASPFRSSPPLVEEDASVFRSLPRRVEVDASAFLISPARAPEDASAPRYEENTVPPAEPPSLEKIWKEMDVALWEALLPAERAKIEAEKKAGEGKHAARHAALAGLCRVRESQAIGSLAEGSCEGREGGVGRPCRRPECSRAQVPHLCLAVHGPGARFRPGGVPIGAESPHW